jgi:anaerobic dimethyl sulfoxide reductase subunit B (iron-sulfur subunit)
VKACPEKCFRDNPGLPLVDLDNAGCVGCGACAASCPYGGIRLKDRRAFKCDGCAARLRDGLKPLCVLVCARGAITIDDRRRLIDEGRAWLKTAENKQKRRQNAGQRRPVNRDAFALQP